MRVQPTTAVKRRTIRVDAALGLLVAASLLTTSVWAQAVAPTPPAPEIVVHLSELGSGRAPAGVGISRQLSVTVAAANPIATVELWAGAELVASRSVAGEGRTSLRTVLSWTPSAIGEVVLLARAVDERGRTAQSNVLRRTVGESADVLGFGLRNAAEGDTLRSIAADLDADLDGLLRVNPTLGADDPIEPGADVAVPLVVSVARTWIFVDSFESGDTSAWSQAIPSRAGSAGPTAKGASVPSIALAIVSCVVSIDAQGDARTTTGLALYRLDPDSEAYVQVDAAAGASALFNDPAGPGTQHYVVGAFTDTTLVLSPPASIDAGAGCGGSWSDPDLVLVEGRLPVDPSSPLEAAYLMLDTSEGMIRVPEDPASVAPRTPSGFDFSRWMPVLAGNEVTVTAVGIQEGVELTLGSSTFIASPGIGLGRIFGGHARVSLDWIESPAPIEVLSREGWVNDPGVLDFRWSTNRPGVTHAVWQVSAFPIPQGVLHPAGLLAEGTIPGNGGDFSIDFTPLLPQPLTGLALDPGPVTYAQVAPPDPDGGGGGGGDPFAFTLSPAAVENLNLPKPEGFFIRIVPFSGDQATGLVSNHVLIHDGPKIQYVGGIIEAPDPGPGDYTMDVAILQEPAAPLAQYAVCWQFVGWDPAAKVDPNLFGWGPLGKYHFGQLQPTWYQIYEQAIASGHTVFCPSSGGGGSSFGFIGDFVDAFIDGIGELGSWISGAWSYIKGWAVDAVTKAVGCETDVCKAAASLALDAALIYAGVPPNLPNFEQAIQAAKGDLSQLVVELAQDAGVPCSELATVGDLTGSGYTCEAAASAAIDEAIDAMYESIRQTANSIDGLYFPPGMMVVPDPRSQPQPVQARVTVHQTATSPFDLDTCDLDLSLFSKWTPSQFEPTEPGYPPGSPDYRRTSLPWMYSVGTHDPLGFWELYVPDHEYKGQIFETEHRHLPEYAPGAPPTAVATKDYWIHRPIGLSTVTTFQLFTSYSSLNGYPPNVTRLWGQTPEATLRLHPDPPNLFIAGASYSVVAWSPCAGFKVVHGDL